MKRCPHCEFSSPSDTECPQCGIIFSKYVEPIPGEPEERVEEFFKEKDRVTTHIYVTAFALPGAFLFAWLAKKFFLTEMLFGGLRVWIHEFGHAFSGWLSGRAATPLGFGWTNVNPNRSIFVFLCFAFLLGVSVWKSGQKKLWGLVAVLGVMFVLQLYFTFGLNPEQFQTLMAWSGIGGELYLGALLVASFYLNTSGRGRWKNLFRYPVLLIGAYSLLNTFLVWGAISRNEASIPWGSLLFGGTDGNGDMNWLFHQVGWRKVEIIRLYVKTGTICLVGVSLLYLTILGKAFIQLAQRGSTMKSQPPLKN